MSKNKLVRIKAANKLLVRSIFWCVHASQMDEMFCFIFQKYEGVEYLTGFYIFLKIFTILLEIMKLILRW
jgi:hypothetical protein